MFIFMDDGYNFTLIYLISIHVRVCVCVVYMNDGLCAYLGTYGIRLCTQDLGGYISRCTCADIVILFSTCAHTDAYSHNQYSQCHFWHLHASILMVYVASLLLRFFRAFAQAPRQAWVKASQRPQVNIQGMITG